MHEIPLSAAPSVATHDGLPSFSSSSVPKSKSKGRAKRGATATTPTPVLERPMGLGMRAVVDDSLSEVSGEGISLTSAAATATATAGYHEAQGAATEQAQT